MKFGAAGLLLSTLAAGSCAAPTTGQASSANEPPSHLGTEGPVCAEANKADVLARMAMQPITPPRLAAGLALRRGEDETPLTRGAAEAALCAGTLQRDDGMSYVDFGGSKSAPVLTLGFYDELGSDNATQELGYVAMFEGYTGVVRFESRSGKHSYEIGIATLTKDGHPLSVDWTNPEAVEPIANELDDALVATFAPDLPPVDKNCSASRRCIATVIPSNDGKPPKTAVFGARDVGMYFRVDLAAGRVPTFLYIFPNGASEDAELSP